MVVRGRGRSVAAVADAGCGSATIGGRPGWIFDATCGGNVNIALPGLQRVGGFTKWASVDTSRSFHPPLFSPCAPPPPSLCRATLFQSAPCAFRATSAGGANHPCRRPHPPLAKAPTEFTPHLRAVLPIFFLFTARECTWGVAVAGNIGSA